MTPRFRDYLRAAFSARPFGMLVPPNWLFLAAVGMLGVVAPGALVLGAGLELGYLAWLSNNPRFRRTVRGRMLAAERGAWGERIERLLATLPEADRARYRALEGRCRAVLGTDSDALGPEGSSGREAQGASLGQLAWMYLRLLVMRRSIEALVRDDGDGDLERQLARLRERLGEPGVGEDLHRSLSGQLELLEQRRRHRAEAREKLAFLEAELARIEQQAELVREQAVVASDPETLSHRLDELTATLGGTAAWVREQQRVYGAVEDLLVESPPLAAAMTAPAAQGEGR